MSCNLFFFFNDTATTEIYTLSLHDALPILPDAPDDAIWLGALGDLPNALAVVTLSDALEADAAPARLRRLVRSEEHTSELQSRQYLVCRLLLEKKNIASSACADNVIAQVVG